MSTKGLLSVVIVLLVAGGVYWFVTDQKGSAPMDESASSNNEASSAMKMSPEAGRAVGKWQSADDAKFTREFREDSTVTDMYEGDAAATMTGTWSQVVDISAEPFEFPAVGGATFLKLVLGGDTLYFAVSTDTTVDKLVLINLSGRGNILTFNRMQ
ncbi:hypothetical protein A2704_05370 [Candidatus Kaiserbacteria bacterium RIFCSPHIGHO2_01_FULL_54_36b]|uniref:Uncharacterized protein n=1 Tax=Candidatus Kaiserbacteria bacterium RIFCSPHIGHO2_01_FULL_54_36b TaxID=1798483 RepID=A0A1F6CMA7_9BACT|nr:MAG: hypothetical protein A2704_05370 [Candidatus Kaiserbacteria bacterium RIFCSPHIGHO2_01_FULL_54_36b]